MTEGTPQIRIEEMVALIGAAQAQISFLSSSMKAVESTDPMVRDLERLVEPLEMLIGELRGKIDLLQEKSRGPA